MRHAGNPRRGAVRQICMHKPANDGLRNQQASPSVALMRLDADSSRHRGVLVFAQPWVLGAVAVWLVNDHVLKDRYGSWWTGKLSDVVGLMVFPLIVAVVIERWSRRAIEWAVATTVIFFASINLVPAADAATEGALSLLIGPTVLTLDPTDVLLLPCAGFAMWAWRAAGDRRAVTRAWGRMVFGLAVMTTLATSPPEAMSEQFNGTIFLDETTDSVEIPFSLTFDGKDAETVGSSILSYTVVPFGAADASYQDVSIETEMLGPGDGLVHVSLANVDAGPVEVRWSMSVSTEGETNFPWPWGNKDAPVPVLTVDGPADTFGPEPLATLAIFRQHDSPGWVTTTHRLQFEMSADAVARLWLSANGPVRLTSSEGSTTSVRPNTSFELTPPDSCATAPSLCQFEVALSAGFNIGQPTLEIHEIEGTVTLVEHREIELQVERFSGTSPIWEFVDETPRPVSATVDLDVPSEVFDRAATFIDVRFSEHPPWHTGERDRGSVRAPSSGLGVRGFGNNCCEPSIGELEVWRSDGEDGPFEAPVDAWIEWEAVVYSPVEIGDLVVTVE